MAKTSGSTRSGGGGGGARQPITLDKTQLRSVVKDYIIAQRRKGEGIDANDIRKMSDKYNVSKSRSGSTYTEIQNAINYFRFSPQQTKFREKYNIFNEPLPQATIERREFEKARRKNGGLATVNL